MKKKFNIVDAVLLLLIIAAAAASFLFLRSRGTLKAAETSPMSFTVEIKDATPEMVEMVEAAGLESNVYRSTDGTYLGKLSKITAEPMTETDYSQLLGRYVTYESQGLYYLYLEVTGDGIETARDISVSGVTVKVGQEIFIKGKGYASGGYIVAVQGSGLSETEDTQLGGCDQMMRYAVRFDNVRRFTADALHEGDRLYDNQTQAYLGTIVDIELRPYTTPEINAAGEAITAENPERYSILVTLEAPCTETENSYYIDGKNELKVGAELDVQSKYVKCSMEYHALIDLSPVRAELSAK